MKKSVIISVILIILLSVAGCSSRIKKSADNKSGDPEIDITTSESSAASKSLESTEELEPTPKTYTYEVRASIHDNLPEYRFVATGKTTGEAMSEGDWAPAFVTGLNVYDEKGLAILSVDFTDILNEVEGNVIYYQMIDTMGLHVSDVNFDGYKDVIILNSFGGAHSNSWYDCWLWDAKTSSFINSKSFTEICNPAVDWDKQCIYSSGGSGADQHDYSIYQYRNGEFVISNTLHWNGSTSVESVSDGIDDIITTEGIYVKEEQLIDGDMETVRDGFLPSKDANALLESYYGEEPWKLDSPRWYMIGGHHADVWLEH
jgi:hypothetical protein